MPKLKQCAVDYERLLTTKYTYIVGKKGQLETFSLQFCKDNFVHAAGLHKLQDIPQLMRIDKEKIFDEILQGNITYADIQKSSFFKKFQSRFDAFCEYEKILDTTPSVIKFNPDKASIRIEADYILESDHKGKIIYTFVKKSENFDEDYICCSFFPKTFSLTVGQESWSLLYKEKINILDESRIIQYNKLYDLDIVVTKKEFDTLKNNADLAKKLQGNIDVFSQDTNNITLKTFKRDRKEIINALSDLRNVEKAPAAQEIKTQYNVSLSPSGAAVLQAPTVTAPTPPPIFDDLKEKITKLLGKVKSAFISPQPTPTKKHTAKETTPQKRSSATRNGSTLHKQSVQKKSPRQEKTQAAATKRTDHAQTEPRQPKADAPQEFRFTVAELKRNAKTIKDKDSKKSPNKAKQKNTPTIDD